MSKRRAIEVCAFHSVLRCPVTGGFPTGIEIWEGPPSPKATAIAGGARRLLPVVLLPLSLATFLLTVVDSAWVLPVFMVLVGFVVGGISTVNGALWAELYGTRHLGAIRAPVTAAMVFSTALAPGLIGFLLDAGVGLDIQLIGMTVYAVAAAVWMVALMPRLNRMAAAGVAT